MLRGAALKFTAAIFACSLGVPAALAQATKKPEDKLVYVLVSAERRVRDPFRGQPLVEFHKSFPKEYADAPTDPQFPESTDPLKPRLSVELEPKGHWVIQTIAIRKPEDPAAPAEMLGEAAWLKPRAVRVAGAPENKLVILDMGDLSVVPDGSSVPLSEKLNPLTHKITVTYKQINYPSVVLGDPKKQGAGTVFTAAKGKNDADVYFSGGATAARGSGPLYSIEAKLGYLHSLRRYGAIGGKATFVSDEGSDVDPDSITVTGSYEKVFVFAPVTGIILRSDFIGGEFNKRGNTRNLTSALDATLVLPSASFGETNFATVDLLAGFEGGKNLESQLDADGSGGIWRWKLGANAHFVALRPPLFNRITFDTEYKLRLPRTDEPFTEEVNGTEATFKTRKPRHFVGSDLDFLFSPAYGLSLKYRYGSLPPVFRLVDHKVSVGFTLKLKQANR